MVFCSDSVNPMRFAWLLFIYFLIIMIIIAFKWCSDGHVGYRLRPSCPMTVAADIHSFWLLRPLNLCTGSFFHSTLSHHHRLKTNKHSNCYKFSCKMKRECNIIIIIFFNYFNVLPFSVLNCSNAVVLLWSSYRFKFSMEWRNGKKLNDNSYFRR